MSNILKYQNPSSPLLIQQVNQSGANFVKRLLDPNRKSIPDWETKGAKIATHKLGWAEDDQGAYVYPEVQEINEQLIDFSRPPYAPGIADYTAHKNNNIVRMSPEEADWFTKNYKQYYPSFKKGGNIHIKKKNRGKFTEYCGGKVTEECIAKGKKSKDPKIRKRATFAANARKWKHENGGILKAQNGTPYGLPGGIPSYMQVQPLSPVGIALNQAKASAKMKGEQQHLPPGVKEVVGPDGQKIAVRTEQPLVPLEQSIAEWMPGTGDVAEVGYIANDVKNGNYGTAALGAGLMFIPGNAGKLLSKYRKTVSKTADVVEDAARKANVSEYINTVDDVLPERQPLTINKSKQFWDGTSKSKLTDAEKAGIPKGERNQPVKLGYRSEFPNDIVIKAEHLKNEMIDLFNSPVYRDRLIKAGYSNEQIDDFLKNRMQLGAVRKAPIAMSSDVELGDAAHWYRNYVKIDPNAKDINEEIFHELGHGSDFSGLMRDPRQPLITKLAFPGNSYYLDPSEVRTRGLGVLQWMKKTGKTIDDFYTPGNTDLNKRAQEFWLYYPEDQGRQYLSTFWKEGGKL